MKRHTLFLTTAILVSCLTSQLPVYAQNEDPLKPQWNKFHSTKEAYALLEGWNKAYPELTSLYSIGNTLRGTPLMVLEITNKQAGDASMKPGYYYDGNIHAGELTGAEVSLHYAWYLLSNYTSNERIKALLDTRVIYIRPKFNPDGADIALNTPTILRSTPRPYDNDGDGLLDEDPGNDLDKNGIITKMRVKSPNGKYRISEKDNRVMVERGPTETGGEYYDLYDEGIDDDGDGRYNEDGVGGIDMNRNFPRNWGLESEQQGAGPYPLSEPETRATIEFLNSHRNVCGVFHGHTAGGFLYRLPSTTNWDNYNMADQRLILELSGEYKVTTGQRVIPSYSNPRLHRHGTLISWSYWDYGVIGYVPEFWGGFVKDYDGDGEVSDLDEMTWNDRELQGKGYVNWHEFDHPEFGKVEIGGWNRKFTFQNPPSHLILSEIEKYVEWMLYLAETTPNIVLNKVEKNVLDKNKLIQITAEVQNIGYLPTNITQRAIEKELISPVRAVLELKQAKLISGNTRTELGHMPGKRNSGDDNSESRRQIEYLVEVTGKNATATLLIISEKGGTIKYDLKLD